MVDSGIRHMSYAGLQRLCRQEVYLLRTVFGKKTPTTELNTFLAKKIFDGKYFLATPFMLTQAFKRTIPKSV